MSGPNAELFVAVLAQIEKHPETWDQNDWRCESGMCFAGWACDLSGVRWANPAEATYGAAQIVHGDSTFSAADLAVRLLGLADTYSEFTDDYHYGSGAQHLFHAANTLDDLYRISAGWLGLDETVLREKVAAVVADGSVQS